MNPLECNTSEEIEILAADILSKSHDKLSNGNPELFYFVLNCQRVIRYYGGTSQN